MITGEFLLIALLFARIKRDRIDVVAREDIYLRVGGRRGEGTHLRALDASAVSPANHCSLKMLR
jgi:hypothetical protein